MFLDDFMEIWALSEWLGMDTDFVKAFGGTERPRKERVAELFNVYASEEPPCLHPHDFRLYLQNLAVELHLSEELVIVVLTHAAGDDVYLTPSLIELWYICANVPGQVGGRYDFDNFAKLCMQLRWHDPVNFGEGIISIVFDAACKYQPHGGSQPSTKLKSSARSTTNNNSRPHTRQETRGETGDEPEADSPKRNRRASVAIQSQSISQKKEFEYLLQLVAERLRARPLALVAAMKKVAGSMGENGVDMADAG